MVALRSYITDDRSLLSFHRGDLIKLLPAIDLEPGLSGGKQGADEGGWPGDGGEGGAAGRGVRDDSEDGGAVGKARSLRAFQAGSSALLGAAPGSFPWTWCSRRLPRTSPSRCCAESRALRSGRGGWR